MDKQRHNRIYQSFHLFMDDDIKSNTKTKNIWGDTLTNSYFEVGGSKCERTNTGYFDAGLRGTFEETVGEISVKMGIAKECFSSYNRHIGILIVLKRSLTIESRKATQFRMKHTEVAL